MSDTLNILLNGPRPTNATSFASPFPDYDLASWKTNGMAHLGIPANKVANTGAGHTWEYPNLLPSATLIEYQATGQTGTITSKTDTFLGGGTTRPTDEWSPNGDNKTQYSTDPALGTGDWWYYEACVPLTNLCQIFGVAGGTSYSATLVNTDIRFQFASSGTGAGMPTITPGGGALLNRSFLIGFGRRSGFGVVRYGTVGGGGVMTEVVNSAAYVPSLGSAFRIGAYTDATAGGYTPNRRRGIRMLQLGVFNPVYQAAFEELALGYNGLY